jgi:hypothetical protein
MPASGAENALRVVPKQLGTTLITVSARCYARVATESVTPMTNTLDSKKFMT